ncbi:hypothetical protein OAE88_00540 [bacterium]|nr:hypothetical protein [bacterium]
MKVNRDKLNPHVNKIMDLVLNVKDDIPENMILMMINYTLAEVASNLRAKLKLYDGSVKPLNNYTYIFAPSGVGKDVSLNALNRIFIDSFRERMGKGFDKHRVKYWDNRSMALVEEGEEDVESAIREEMRMVSPFSYRIDGGTVAGFSKSRVTYDYYDIGAINLVIDELGANYQNIRSVMALMLSSYEDGNTEGRQLKTESVIAVKGVPSNFLGYSSPALVFDGGITEKSLLDDLSQGMARRSFFAYAEKPEPLKLTAEEIVKQNRARATSNKGKIEETNKYFAELAHPKNMYKEVHLSEKAEILIAEYQIKCDSIVKANTEIQEQERLELVNRSWKATRLAGVYAFISGLTEVDEDCVKQAIYVADISGESFMKVMNQPPVYERVFDFIKSRKKTSDIDLEKQKWYSGNKTQKRELLSLARAYGFENDYLFRIKEVESVEFYSFIEVPKTDVEKITISISKDITKGFKKKVVPFEIIHEVVTNDDFKYSAGTFKGGHRNKENYEKKQNLVIIDIDDGMKLETAKIMFSDYKCFMATTKSHQKEKNDLVCDRFRIIFITDRTIKLDSETYGKFMKNVYESLGVPADQSCSDSSRFYFGAEGDYWYSEGSKLLEISDLIPDTTKSKERDVMLSSSGIGSTDGAERFLLEEAVNGNRNHTMLRYALLIKDSGYSLEDAKEKVLSFNDKLPDGLSVKEIEQTVFKTLGKKYD